MTQHSWEDVLAHLRTRTRRSQRIVELSVCYRTPSEIMALAARVLAVAAPALRAPRAVRSSGVEPAVRSVGRDDLAGGCADAVRELRAELGASAAIAVITADSAVADLEKALFDAGVAAGDAVIDGLDDDVVVVASSVMKGLEFDGVVVAEPAQLVEEAAQGMRALFVALTRATRRLTIVHARPLPEVLGL